MKRDRTAGKGRHAESEEEEEQRYTDTEAGWAGCELAEQPWHCAVACCLLAGPLPRVQLGRGSHFCLDTKEEEASSPAPPGGAALVGTLGLWDAESHVGPSSCPGS